MIRGTNRRGALLRGAVVVVAAAGVAGTAVPAAAQARHEGTAHGADRFAASLKGANEVPVAGGPAVGDENGAALQFIEVSGDRVAFAVKFRGIGRPTALHLHQGARGANGAVKVPLLAEELRGGGHSATGSVKVTDEEFPAALKKDPGSFYVNLHTAEFPGGAVRGQLHRVTEPFPFDKALRNVQASVVRGKQIYECGQREDGSHAFAQRDVRARLAGGIAHSFTAPGSGTPRWIAPDGSAVTGAVISKSPNGAANIPELGLQATQAGEERGLLARSVEILRLNTVGGVAPAGSCDPEREPVAEVPYEADYVFINR